MTKNKRIIAKCLVLLLLVSAFVLPKPVTDVEAAANKALRIAYSFNGQNYEENGDDCWYNNGYTVSLPGTEKSTALSKLKLGAVIYVPKTALSAEGAALDISPSLNIYADSEGNYLGWLGGRISLTAVNEGESIGVYAWDEVKQKNVKSSTYASYKEGTGTLKNYYIITVKNVPVLTTITGDDDTTTKVTSATKYPFNVAMSITGENAKTSGKLYVDNVTVKNGSTKVVNHTFSKSPEWFSVVNKEKELSTKKVVITTIK